MTDPVNLSTGLQNLAIATIRDMLGAAPADRRDLAVALGVVIDSRLKLDRALAGSTPAGERP